MLDRDVKNLGSILKLLAEPSRLRILYGLGLDCRPVSDIVRATGMTQTNVSFHLRLLREAGLVRPERRGPFVYYCLSDTKLLEILEDLENWIATREQNNPRASRTPNRQRRSRLGKGPIRRRRGSSGR